jgi:NAD(P)-dependent dehydrogenase (short-subunit alcohol dehydrogenase family)
VRSACVYCVQEVPLPEMVEVMTINSIAPFVINGRLRALMERTDAKLKFIVNVSAMEGKFYRHKNSTHPHTNMAKAALNMMTRTSAQDYRKVGIYMTAVDTGWINDEKPIERATKHLKQHNFQTPLDEIDAAARVLDPIIAPLLDEAAGKDMTLQENEPPFGVFLKDFARTEW